MWEALAESAKQGKTWPSYNNYPHEALAEMRGGRLAHIDVCIGS